jgi:dihydrofolate synthase/folylpolyglutamate synthase
MDLLGGSLAKVAGEKAGIIKKNIPVVIGETQPELKDIFIARAKETDSEVSFADAGFICSISEKPDHNGKRKYRMQDLDKEREISGIIPLGGDYQTKNLQTLFQACRSLEYTFRITGKSIVEGIRNVIANTGLMGRWQILKRKPLVICDTGHNREGLEYVIRQIGRINAAMVHFVIGFVSDKDLSLVLPLFPGNARYYFTKASVQRALDEKILQTEASKYNLIGECYPSVIQAYEAAVSNASPDDLVFVGGSTFVVAEVV